MATAASTPPYASSSESATHAFGTWLSTVDHKRIGALYMYTALSWFAIGGLEALVMRVQLQRPNGHVVSAELFNLRWATTKGARA
jgi:cytochrome c oxidase subunit I